MNNSSDSEYDDLHKITRKKSGNSGNSGYNSGNSKSNSGNSKSSRSSRNSGYRGINSIINNGTLKKSGKRTGIQILLSLFKKKKSKKNSNMGDESVSNSPSSYNNIHYFTLPEIKKSNTIGVNINSGVVEVNESEEPEKTEKKEETAEAKKQRISNILRQINIIEKNKNNTLSPEEKQQRKKELNNLYEKISPIPPPIKQPNPYVELLPSKQNDNINSHYLIIGNNNQQEKQNQIKEQKVAEMRLAQEAKKQQLEAHALKIFQKQKKEAKIKKSLKQIKALNEEAALSETGGLIQLQTQIRQKQSDIRLLEIKLKQTENQSKFKKFLTQKPGKITNSLQKAKNELLLLQEKLKDPFIQKQIEARKDTERNLEALYGTSNA
jgi:hypothetical protein